MAQTQISTRDDVFNRVTVDFAVEAGARVEWSLFRNFTAPGPYTFQLQIGATGQAASDDWLDLGDPVVNGFFAFDDNVRRLSAKEWDVHYRVQLTDGLGAVYYSEPVPPYGILNRRDWLNVREALRRFRLQLRLDNGWDGWLLKRRREGAEPDPYDLALAVTDPITNEILDVQSPLTVGTAFEQGYYEPVEFRFALSPSKWGPRSHGSAVRNSDDPQSQPAVTVGFPRISSRDVFVHAASDRRYEVTPVSVIAERKGTPVVIGCDLKLLPASDIVYTVEMPDA
jgi:hypothetical protein